MKIQANIMIKIVETPLQSFQNSLRLVRNVRRKNSTTKGLSKSAMNGVSLPKAATMTDIDEINESTHRAIFLILSFLSCTHHVVLNQRKKQKNVRQKISIVLVITGFKLSICEYLTTY